MNENEALVAIRTLCDAHLEAYEVVRTQSEAIEGNHAQYLAVFAIITKEQSITQALIADFLRHYTQSGGKLKFLGTKKEIENLRSDILLIEATIDAFKN